MRTNALVGLLLSSLAWAPTAQAMPLAKRLVNAAEGVVRADAQAQAAATRERSQRAKTNAAAITKLLDPRNHSAQVKRALARGWPVYLGDHHFIKSDFEGGLGLYRTLYDQGARDHFRRDTTIEAAAAELGPTAEVLRAFEDHATALNNRDDVAAKIGEIYGSHEVREALRISGVSVRLSNGLKLRADGLLTLRGVNNLRERLYPSEAVGYVRSMHSSHFQALTAEDVERSLTRALASTPSKD